MTAEHVDAEFTAEQATALAVREERGVVAWTPGIEGGVDYAIEQSRGVDRFIEAVLKPGLHYGKIPG